MPSRSTSPTDLRPGCRSPTRRSHAVLLVPLALMPAWAAAALWAGASAGALATVVVVVRRALWRAVAGVAGCSPDGRRTRPRAGVAEPHVRTGQPVRDAAVLVDLTRPERRWSGVLVGIVAGVKLIRPSSSSSCLALRGLSNGCRPGLAGLRRHRRSRVRGDAAFVSDATGRTVCSTCRPGRPPRPWRTGPVRQRRAHHASSTVPRRPCSGWWSPARSRSQSWSSQPDGGGAATGYSAPALEQWPCCSPPRSRGRTTGCGRCRSRWCCGNALDGRAWHGPPCSSPARSVVAALG